MEREREKKGETGKETYIQRESERDLYTDRHKVRQREGQG